MSSEKISAQQELLCVEGSRAHNLVQRPSLPENAARVQRDREETEHSERKEEMSYRNAVWNCK